MNDTCESCIKDPGEARARGVGERAVFLELTGDALSVKCTGEYCSPYVISFRLLVVQEQRHAKS
jgi:hypothetical protein